MLIAISDDQSYPHASAYGEPVIQTPAFDEVVRRGVRFDRAYTPCPGCSPMRAAFLTGQHIWQLREAGTHASSFPSDLKTFPYQLVEAGYRAGFTGKGWSPGNYNISGWKENPAGTAYRTERSDSPSGISNVDYAGNFASFLDQTDSGAPFCFWYGGHEPHRTFKKGIGAAAGMDPREVRVPEFLPDNEAIRGDMLDYFYEIQWFDQHLGRMLRELESRGMLENTIVIVTSDNGMAFPRAKANLYDYGIHMPLAIAWPSGNITAAGPVNADLVSLLDVTATIYDACQVAPPESQPLSGSSLLAELRGAAKIERAAVYSGRERHSSSRYNSLGYPSRAVRTGDYLYIRNFAPERWPAGTPQKFASVTYDAAGRIVSRKLGPPHGGYHDIDACPTLDWMIAQREDSEVQSLFAAAVALRPAEELYRVSDDAACLDNLADKPEFSEQLHNCRELLNQELNRTGDPRMLSGVAWHVSESYPRYSPLRWFPAPDWLETSTNLSSMPTQGWLEERRPRADAN